MRKLLERRPSKIRIEEAVETGADVLAVSCPSCLSMFGDAIKTTGYEEDIEVKDISKLVAESI
ncbi:hypothetical protein AKJ45_00810 [candidate division MSBL1 archaeon SCGC-AAA261F19]|uniref:Cysteine-rich domain-containing protein n=1 Tax=candidate division MSBL1 archaeon SCGC-AAA261F19 TaxID=1698275 RepID=A0A133VBB5_9EURY|nr:hypothetical protein AKJ45_00810 [candidate division MSBL1 archaeon SCGC-AAA261F19]